MTIAVLFARADSHYKQLPDVEVYDMERDARTYDGPWPVVAHPPCRSWGRLRTFAKPRPDERNLARLAVGLVREFGGVLEHPESSALWKAQQLPAALNAERDLYGGWTLPVHQWWWGHRAQKRTWLYIVGCEPADIPDMPMRLGQSDCRIRLDKRRPDGTHIRKGDPDFQPILGDAEREHTPPAMAAWLVELANRCARQLETA